MNITTNIGFVLAVSSLVLVVSESVASAACNPPPPECLDTARDTAGYNAGVSMGESLVNQIWNSSAVGQNIDNWDILKQQVDVTIPLLVTSAYKKPVVDQYTDCRIKGLLQGTVCQMNTLDPIPGCQLDGVDWGSISAGVYCGLSVALNGLADVKPWGTPPAGTCGQNFELYCSDVYRYGATYGSNPLSTDVLNFLTTQGIDPADLLQSLYCAPFTVSPFDVVFEDSVAIDCAYTL